MYETARRTRLRYFAFGGIAMKGESLCSTRALGVTALLLVFAQALEANASVTQDFGTYRFATYTAESQFTQGGEPCNLPTCQNLDLDGYQVYTSDYSAAQFVSI